MTLSEAYDKLLQGFMATNNLDVEDVWPEEVEADFRRRYRELQIAYGVKPL